MCRIISITIQFQLQLLLVRKQLQQVTFAVLLYLMPKLLILENSQYKFLLDFMNIKVLNLWALSLVLSGR